MLQLAQALAEARLREQAASDAAAAAEEHGRHVAEVTARVTLEASAVKDEAASTQQR